VSKVKNFAVVWAESADQDLARIVEYIANDSVIDALNVLARIKKQAEALKEFPERGRVVPELASQGIYAYREKVVAPWRLIYRIEAEQVYVFTVVDSRRNLEDILLERLVEAL
jgi:plasmid stabilization system protein ParE